MYLSRLIYTSTISPSFSQGSIEDILNTARRNNNKNHVTGMLLFNRKYFLQSLEGSRVAVNNPFHNIANDPRHNQLIMLDYREVTSRAYTGWSMGYLAESLMSSAIISKFSGTQLFNPYEMSGESAHQLMLASKDMALDAKQD